MDEKQARKSIKEGFTELISIFPELYNEANLKKRLFMTIDINITRISNTKYSFGSSNADGIRVVAKALTFRNPDPFAYSEKIYKFDRRDFTFKIGMLPTLLDYIKELREGRGGAVDVRCNVKDYEFSLPDGIEIDSRMEGRYVHQRRAVEAFYGRRFGIIVVPTRGGKTFIASEILRIFLESEKEGNFLFIVDNVTLFSQAVSDINRFFERYGGVSGGIGEIKAGSVDTSHRVTVGMIQTIQSTLSDRCRDRVKKRELRNYLRDLKFLCVDEIHDNCSDAKLKTYKMCRNLDYQLCLSATPYRANAFVQNLKLKEWSGDIIYAISEETLRERGVLSEYKVIMMLIDHNDIDYSEFDERGRPFIDDMWDFNGLRKGMIYDSPLRNAVLYKVIEILRRLELKTLVLFQSVEHGVIVSMNTDIPFISGESSSEEREEEKKKFLETERGGFLLASNIFKKGVTLPEVEVLINVDGGLEDANTIQKKGRVLGTTDSKKRSLIIDFFDVYDLYFSDHSSTRLNTYVESVGEKNVGILDVTIDDCYDTFERWCRKWFGIDYEN